MAKQTFTTGQVLLASQLTSLQQTAMLGGAASAKTASYTLVAADAGTAISMTSTSATTITVNTGLFAAGDTVQITNLGTGVCTITAGTATVNTAASLALAQYESGTLDFTSSSAAVFIKGAGAAAGGGGKVLQVVEGTTSTAVNSSSATFADTNLTATITPSSATSKILVIVSQGGCGKSAANLYMYLRLMRGATQIAINQNFYTGTSIEQKNEVSMLKLDSPSTTSATTYKTQFNSITGAGTISVNGDSDSSIVLMEIGA